MGTLISIADVRTVSAEMIQSLNASPRVAKLRTTGTLEIVPGEFRQYTTITNFDKQLFLNRFVSSLNEADRDGSYRFLDREPVLEERRLQAAGHVSLATSAASPADDASPGLPGLRGARFVLSGDVREILHRSPEEGGGEVEKRTVQYSLRLTQVSDGAVVWSHSHEIVKTQLIGAVYR